MYRENSHKIKSIEEMINVSSSKFGLEIKGALDALRDNVSKYPKYSNLQDEHSRQFKIVEKFNNSFPAF